MENLDDRVEALETRITVLTVAVNRLFDTKAMADYSWSLRRRDSDVIFTESIEDEVRIETTKQAALDLCEQLGLSNFSCFRYIFVKLQIVSLAKLEATTDYELRTQYGIGKLKVAAVREAAINAKD